MEIQVVQEILFIRGKRVLLDSQLADIYKVETKRMNEAVRRNISRFPEEFMFQVTSEEWNNLKTQFATSSWGGKRKLYTPAGVPSTPMERGSATFRLL